MLNTRYIIYNPDTFPIINKYADGNAWFVRNIKVAANADQEILALDSVNPKTTAVIQNKFSNIIQNDFKFDSTATIELKSYDPDDLSYEAKSVNNQLAVFSEIYYKDGWNAYIDGKLTPYCKADYVLRALNVPSGKHIIEFKFEPSMYKKSKNLSYAGSLLIILFITGTLFYEYYSVRVSNTNRENK